MIFDRVIVVDAWEEHDSTFSSEPVAAAPGYHYVEYEFRSTDSVDASAPTNSFAVLSWSGFNSTGIDRNAHTVYADVGWFACPNGTGTLHGFHFEAGLNQIPADLSVDLRLSELFVNSPHTFASYLSIDSARGGHVRSLIFIEFH